MNTGDELKAQGTALFKEHDYESASRIFHQARDAYLESEQLDMVAEMKVNIGLVHRELGETQQALDMMQEALRTFQDLGDDLRTALVLGNLGGVYSALDDTEKAEISYRQAANIFKEKGQEDMYSDTMLALGGMLLKAGQWLKGGVVYQMALENRRHLSFSQRIIKMLAGTANRFLGAPPTTT